MRLFLIMSSLLFLPPWTIQSQSTGLDVEGSILFGDSNDPNPRSGTLRWTGLDFEGFDGTAWKSLTGLAGPNLNNGTLTDIDGNAYKTTTINGRLWMAENLRTTHFNDGRDIPHIVNDAVWTQSRNEKYPGYCWINNNDNYKYPYGALYNWYAVDDTKICPVGWHIPTLPEWLNVRDALGGLSVAGGALKSTGTLQANTGLWESPNTDASNSSGFSAIAGGSRTSQGSFLWFGENSYWWTATESNPTGLAYSIWLGHNSGDFNHSDFNKDVGFSIRCVQD